MVWNEDRGKGVDRVYRLAGSVFRLDDAFVLCSRLGSFKTQFHGHLNRSVYRRGKRSDKKTLKKSKWGWEASSEEDLVSGRPREVLLRKNDTSGGQKGDAAVRDSPSYAETERCALTIGCRALWQQRPRSLNKKGRKVSKVGT